MASCDLMLYTGLSPAVIIYVSSFRIRLNIERRIFKRTHPTPEISRRLMSRASSRDGLLLSCLRAVQEGLSIMGGTGP